VTLDYKDPDEIVLGKDLKPGDCIRAIPWSKEKNGNEMSIIVATTFCDDEHSKELKKFYQEHPAYSVYDINCPEDGPYSCRIYPEQEFIVIRSRKDILYTYKTIEYELLKRSADLMNQRNELMKIKNKAIDIMNNRLNKKENNHGF